MLSIWAKARGSKEHTHVAKAVTQANLWGGPLIPSHMPQPVPHAPLRGLQHHTAPTEKSSISGWQRYHGRRDGEEPLGSCVAAVSDKCASMRVANLSHVKHIWAEGKRHFLTGKIKHTRRLVSAPPCGIPERCTLSLHSWQRWVCF